MAGCGQVAHGGGVEITARGKDYPVREESVMAAVSALSFEKETVIQVLLCRYGKRNPPHKNRLIINNKVKSTQ